MIFNAAAKDLIVLAADKSMKLGLESLLVRHKDLGIRPLSSDVLQHPGNDPGVLRKSHDFLRTQLRLYRHAIAMCDRDGCGKEASTREQLETAIEQRLQANGWENRAAAVVIDPELETWIWGDWNFLAKSIRWSGDGSVLRNWLVQRNLLSPDQAKPPHPKEALQSVMRYVQFRFTSAVHQSMAQQAEFAKCTDPAFLKMLTTLRAWFPSR